MVAIVDIHGNPIQSKTLTEPQTARVAHLHREFAGHPVRGLTPGGLAAILQAAEHGDLVQQAELYEDIEEKDGHVLAEMSKRKRALVGLEWDIAAPRNASAAEEAQAAYIKELVLDLPDFEDLITDLLDAVGKGYSCVEIEWQRLGKEWFPKSYAHRPATWFTVDRATRTQLRLRDSTHDGAPLQPFGWITHQHKAKSGYLARGGLGRILAWPFLFKNYSVRDLAEFLEIYGLPLRLGKYGSNATAEEKATLLRAVTEIGHAAAGIIPEGMAIEFTEAAKGASDPYMAMIDWCERTQSKAILGQVLSAEAKNTGLGSGVANLQGDVLWELTVSDARQLAATLTRELVYPLLALNQGVTDPRRCPRFVFDTAVAEDLTAYADALPKLVGVGMKIPARWAHTKLRIPEPEEDEEVLIAPKPPASPFGLPGFNQPGSGDPGGDAPEDPAAQARAALKATPGGTTTPAEQLAAQLADESAAALKDWLDRIRGFAQEANSLEELRDTLLNAYGNLPSKELAKVMQAGFAVANLTGRYEIAKGAGIVK